MPMNTDQLKVAPSLKLRAPNGAPVEINDVRAEFDTAGGRLWVCRLIFTVSPKNWGRIDSHGWLHMPAEVRGPSFADGFDDDAPVEITARLRADALEPLAAMDTTDKWDLAAELLEPEHATDVHLVDSWEGLTVTQQRGDVKAGFATQASGLL